MSKPPRQVFLSHQGRYFQVTGEGISKPPGYLYLSHWCDFTIERGDRSSSLPFLGQTP